MRRSLPALFFLFLGTNLIQHVQAAFFDIEPVLEPPEPAREPIENGGDTIPIYESPAAPAAPLPEGNEAESKEEDTDYGEILEHVFDLLDAITSVADGSPTTESAPLPTVALPCYSVLSIYHECALHNREFPKVGFPIQASCLCYVTKGNDTVATWAPGSYDGFISRCNNFAQTQTLVSSITKVGNSSSDFSLCSSAGDVRATPALAAVSSTTIRSTTPASATTTASTPNAPSTGVSGDRIPVLRPLVACIGLWLCRMVIKY